MDVEKLLAAVDPDQRQVVEALRGPVVVRAGAGTGKTRAITYRIAHGVHTGVYHPQNVLAVTFTSRAAGEMRARLRDLGAPGVQAQTFHAAALRQLSYFWPHAVGGPLPQLIEHKAGLVAAAAAQLGMNVDRANIRDLSAEIEWSKVCLVDDYVERSTKEGRGDIAGYSPDQIADLIRAYEDVKSAQGALDFEDILLILCGIMIEREDITRQIRHQYRYFVVDEYQDVSPLQQRLLDLWLGERQDLCVVGDVSQTIYSFTGATPAYLRDFTKRFKKAVEIELVRDYRSTPQVVELANTVIAPGRLAGAVTLQAQRPSSAPVSFTEYDDDAAEAAGVIRDIQRLIDRGVAKSDIAILLRTNGQSQEYENALAHAGISYVVRGGERFFSRKEIREAMRMVKTFASTGVELTLSEAIREVVGRLGWSQQPPTETGSTRERWESLNALVQLADDMVSTRSATVKEFSDELHERASMQAAPTVEGVTISTLHAAKGLEWDAVYLVGLSEGLLPISLATSADAIEEERRLLYVGVTRAREHLALSYARTRSESTKTQRKRSRFLDHVWPGAQTISRATASRRKSREIAADFAANHPEDQGLLEALKTWRAAEAMEHRKPPYLILHDTVLIAIALAKPATIKELGKIKGIGATKLDMFGSAIISIIDSRR